MKSLIISALTFLSLVCVSWIFPQKSLVSKSEWLIGTWENKTEEGSIYETWIKKNDKELAGKSYMLNKSDTMILETIQILEKQGELFYIPTVPTQDGGKAVPYGLKQLTDHEFMFENPKHNTPRVIYYQRLNNDRLVAEIWSIVDNKTHKVQFPMVKIE